MIGFIPCADWGLKEENRRLIFIHVINMLSKPCQFGPLSSVDNVESVNSYVMDRLGQVSS